MPRNPNKTRCQVAGCRNWAMRGHTRCRAHRDAELGPRPVGAPRGNLNALKTGQHAHPLSPPDLSNLAQHLVHEPDLLPYHLGIAAQSIQSRTRDPYQVLLAFQATLADLQPHVAHQQLITEIYHFLQGFPSANRKQVHHLILTSLPPFGAEHQLLTFRRLVAEIQLLLPARLEARHDPPRHLPPVLLGNPMDNDD